MPDDLLYANGINAATGGALLPALATGTVAKVARGETLTTAELADLEQKRDQLEGSEDNRTHGVIAGIAANDLGQAGWGILTAAEDARRCRRSERRWRRCWRCAASRLATATGNTTASGPSSPATQKTAGWAARAASRGRWTPPGHPTTC